MVGDDLSSVLIPGNSPTCRALIPPAPACSRIAGNSGFSWSDVLLGDLPNVYVYAANNPSESIIAKRRGYGTIVSHNVPPYGRWGLLLTDPACLGPSWSC